MEKIKTISFAETRLVGQKCAGEILASGAQKSAVVLALSGDLGAGKTTFLQGFAKGLGITENVLSPTFIVMKKFKIPAAPAGAASRSSLRAKRGNPRFNTFYHFDLYRLESEKDLHFFDFQEIISNPKNIVAIEWPEKLGNLLPKNNISILFEHKEEGVRELTIDA